MSLRIAWACYPRNVSLGIAAQIFVYVGTIILYLCNWFFTQRVIRAQHPHIGWSTPYRIFHRSCMIALIVALIIIIVASIQRFFTLDENTLQIDRILQLAAFTYFAFFTLAPLLMLLVSFVIPRRETEKFGAGRMRNAIAVLFVGSFILALGQCFRTITGWLPEIPLRNAQGQFNAAPWYFSKASFYSFNFLTELLVVIFYAVMRVDLRFYVPDGAKKPGDYRAYRESLFIRDTMAGEGERKQHSEPTGTANSITSNDSLHEYDDSVFEDTRTLTDSLRFHSSVMEIDDRTGLWKIKGPSDSTRASIRSVSRPSNRSQSSLWDPARATLIHGGAPPVPSIPQHSGDWPFRNSDLVGQSQVGGSSALPGEVSRLQRANSSNSAFIEEGGATDLAFKQLAGNSLPDLELTTQTASSRSRAYNSDVASETNDVYIPPSSLPEIACKKEYRQSYSPSSGFSYRSASPTDTYTSASSDVSTKKSCTTSPTVTSKRQSSSTYRGDKPTIHT